MDEKDKLVIRLRRNEIRKIQLIISDDGKGIDEHNLEKIFTPFFTTKTGNKGTGLGLYIVRNICKNHNAEISCESKINSGTTFIIRFKKMNDEEQNSYNR